jgi:Stage II sporulation protein
MSNRLLRGVVALAIALGALAFPSAEPSRAASAKCTGWTSSLVAPTSIRVYRTGTRRTVTVPFRTYVEKVVAAEWGRTTAPAALRIGAVTVKQYAWYFTMFWRGGRDAAGRCYDVSDSTRDQLYDPGRRPSAAQLAAVAETWNVSLRKGDRFFMTGYRPGTGSCTAHIDGWRLYQRDAIACVRTYGDTAESLARRFFSSVSWTVPGAGDYTGDGRGDLAALTVDPVTGETTAQVFTSDIDYRTAARAEARAGMTLDETPADQLLGRASGDVDADGRTDLVQLVRTADGIALEVMRGGPTGLAPAATWWREAIPTEPAVPADPADPANPANPASVDSLADSYRLVVADFDADGRADAGIVRALPVDPPAPPEAPGDPPPTAVPLAALDVVASSGTRFAAAERTWEGPADLATSTVLAGDVTGDGRGDLVVLSPLPTGGTDLLVAASTARNGLAPLASWGTEPASLDSIKPLLGDATRDGRDDLVIVRRTDQDGVRLVVYRTSATAPTFARRYFSDPLAIPFSGSRFSTADLSGDGRADLVALVDRGVDAAGLPLGTDAWTFISDGLAYTSRAWFTSETLNWATTFPY